MKATETDLKLVSMPCTLCGNNCKVSLLEQFKVRNELCKEREQNNISTEADMEDFCSKCGAKVKDGEQNETD